MYFAQPEITSQKVRQHIPIKILDTISYIVVSLHLPLTVKSLANRVHQNSEYFSRLFQQYTGSRPVAYITEKRIERAQYLIMTSTAKYKDIAQQTGFESLSHFSRTLKKITGMNPSEFRRQLSKSNSRS
ncbi:MAG: AraC family transcriptional regulator [Pedobacter sp.]|nr:MAG: AraC family transcriptional regulator [Pedobacter sp.]